jgi:hypothetical protein
MFVRGDAEPSLFQVIVGDILSHRSDTSAGFGGEAVRRKLLHGKVGESFSLLIRVGDEVAHDDTFSRCFGYRLGADLRGQKMTHTFPHTLA